MSAGVCPVCGSADAGKVYVKNGYTLVRCHGCRLIQVRPMPGDAELRAHYQNESYFEGSESQGYRNYADMHKALEPFFRRRLHALAAVRPVKGHLLDFGCADGYFLQLAREDGWDVGGVELSDEMANRAEAALNSLIYRSLTAVPQGQADAVTLWETIEHLPRPLEALGQLRDCLRPGGVLMLSTPNTGHWQARKAPDDWTAYRPPSHLLYFTRQTLHAALERAGFTNIIIQGMSPLPRLPFWLDVPSRPLARSLANGGARHWRTALYAWRAVRAAGLGLQRLTHPAEDYFATLEALAVCPA